MQVSTGTTIDAWHKCFLFVLEIQVMESLKRFILMCHYRQCSIVILPNQIPLLLQFSFIFLVNEFWPTGGTDFFF
jgi:hypothetical protein